MKRYEQPAIELIKFSVMEVLATSESEATSDSSSEFDTEVITGI